MKRALPLLVCALPILGLPILINGAAISWLSAVSLLFWHYACLMIVLAALVTTIVYKPARLFSASLALAFGLSYAWPLIGDFLANPATAKSAQSYKVISYNWLAEGQDREAFYNWLAEEDPDIIAIQEFRNNDLAPLLASQKRTWFFSENQDDTLILSKYPLTPNKVEKFAQRRLVVTRAQLPSGELHIFGAHAPTLRDIELLGFRSAYISRLSRFIPKDQTPKIVLGDFNMTTWDPLFYRLKSKSGLHEQPRLIPLLTRIAVRRNWAAGSPIDHVLASQSVRIQTCQTGPLMSSDHKPLICQIQF